MPRNISQVVLSKIEQCWPEKDPSLVMKILHRYGEEDDERESPRIQLAIIKLNAGDLIRLEEHIDLAKKDYRDVLAFA